MSRSGYNDDCCGVNLINWRGAVASAIRGKRGQAFLFELLQAMAKLPERKLIDYDLEREGSVCALGAVGRARGVDMSRLDPEDREAIAAVFDISPALAAEIAFMNDEAPAYNETPEQRFGRMRAWVEHCLTEGESQ